jgi:hypothetical protein
MAIGNVVPANAGTAGLFDETFRPVASGPGSSPGRRA